ncbi:hypothetical protein E2C01_070724 [Portunus trituberculatus]|uniref:Uncharacterized protein n=1 Tax=Portunus trituberculatus TaxID=210409 RepID=A0A5B7I675_PORTR|nr:hypothetical protein [Portunus trituberculatus]
MPPWDSRLYAFDCNDLTHELPLTVLYRELMAFLLKITLITPFPPPPSPRQGTIEYCLPLLQKELSSQPASIAGNVSFGVNIPKATKVSPTHAFGVSPPVSVYYCC